MAFLGGWYDQFLGGTIVDFLGDKRLLLVFDNCEQVIDAVAELADRILRGTDKTHMLITSREPLR